MYDYKQAIKDDIHTYIEANYEIDYLVENDEQELYDQLSDELWCIDEITGNGNWGYPADLDRLKTMLGENLDLIVDACTEFDVRWKDLPVCSREKLWRYLDTTVRCYLLGSALYDVLEELYAIPSI